MSQFTNTPQSFFYNMNRTTVNTALSIGEQYYQPNAYYTGGYTTQNNPPRLNPMTVALAQDAVQPSKGAEYYLQKPFNTVIHVTETRPIANTRFSPNGETFPTAKNPYFVQK